MPRGPLALRHLRLPGRAGELQDADDVDGLLLELAGAPERYHGFLAEEFARQGRRLDALLPPAGTRPADAQRQGVLAGVDPNSSVVAKRLLAVAEAQSIRQEILFAETALRDAVRRNGRIALQAIDLEEPVATFGGRLLDRAEAERSRGSLTRPEPEMRDQPGAP